jgi:hypothetical protein
MRLILMWPVVILVLLKLTLDHFTISLFRDTFIDIPATTLHTMRAGILIKIGKVFFFYPHKVSHGARQRAENETLSKPTNIISEGTSDCHLYQRDRFGH